MKLPLDSNITNFIASTINLHDEVSVIEKGQKIASWEISARKRKLRF
ncbi:hypothetical protein [Flagellimonas sp. 2504JD4-2]